MTRRLLVGTFLALVACLCVTAYAQGQDGRWKIQGDQCVFDPNDSGPDQCAATMGRWKVEGDACIFDPNDSGPDQCRPQPIDAAKPSSQVPSREDEVGRADARD